MDSRKNNGGHSTKGKAGRPKKADEIKLIETMDAIAVPDKVWKALWNKCTEGDVQALKAWLSYRYGMPRQQVDHTTQGDKIASPPITWIDGDTK